MLEEVEVDYQLFDDRQVFAGFMRALDREIDAGRVSRVGVDAELSAERLRLLQIAFDPADGLALPPVALVDARAVNPYPLRRLLCTEEVTKVAHDVLHEQVAWSADLALRYPTADRSQWQFGNVFDTRAAWLRLRELMLKLPESERPHPLSPESLRQSSLRFLAGELCGIPLSKKHQRSNWGAVQLREAQLRYAAKDAAVLLQVADAEKALAATLELRGLPAQSVLHISGRGLVKAERLLSPEQRAHVDALVASAKASVNRDGSAEIELSSPLEREVAIKALENRASEIFERGSTLRIAGLREQERRRLTGRIRGAINTARRDGTTVEVALSGGLEQRFAESIVERLVRRDRRDTICLFDGNRLLIGPSDERMIVLGERLAAVSE